MTVNGRKYSLPTRIKDIMRFQETFPSQHNNNNSESYLSKRGGVSRSLTPSPKENRRRASPQQSASMGQIEAIREDDVSTCENGFYLFRSNSWSGSRRGLRPQLSHLTVRSIADTHRSSTLSLPDVIEEDSSEEEFSELQPIGDEFHTMCFNCRHTNNSFSSMDSIGSSTTDYFPSNEITSCYNCRHLKHNSNNNNNHNNNNNNIQNNNNNNKQNNNNKSQLTVPQSITNNNNNNENGGRRLPWTCHDAPYSPRATRKNSNNGVELPIISEPTSLDENDGDGDADDADETKRENEEIQKLVKKEVDRLLKFNSKLDPHHHHQPSKTVTTLEFYH